MASMVSARAACRKHRTMAILLAEANRRSFQTLYRYPQLAGMRRVAGCTSVSADNPLSPKDPISLNRSSRARNCQFAEKTGIAEFLLLKTRYRRVLVL